MITYVLGRFLLLIPVLFGITAISFLLVHLIPGNPAAVILGITATPAQIASLDRQLGLDDPLPVQFGHYLLRVLHADLGTSINLHVSVLSLIGGALPNTIQLGVAALLITLVLAVPLGVASAVLRNSPFDLAAMVLAQLGVSMPVFWLGTLLVELLALRMGLVPSFGIGPDLGTTITAAFQGNEGVAGSYIGHLLLPALTLGLSGTGLVSRMVRASMIDVLQEDYIRTARAKGLKYRTVIWRHAFRNALLPVVTIVGLQFGYLLGGAVIVESIFSWPGVGRLTVDGILARDFPLVQGCVLVIAVLFAVVNLVVDVSYAYIDPKVRYD